MGHERMRTKSYFHLLVGLAVLSGISCDSCGGKGGGGGGSGGAGGWLVGQAGLMLRIDPTDRQNVGRYPLESKANLLAIACRGENEAWVTGEGGLVLATNDGGASWRTVDVGAKANLRGVALGRDTVYVAGDDRLLRVSHDNGTTWMTIQSPPVGWTAVASRDDGRAALVTTREGQVYRYDASYRSLFQVGGVPAGGLNDVAMAEDGLRAAAVGDNGAILVSMDGGLTWRDGPAGSTGTLRSVWVLAHGRSFLAVGDGGALVEGEVTGGRTTTRTIGPATLRGLHMEATGRGTAVGDRGTVLLTDDFGRSWLPVETGETRDLFGVDALHAGGHL